MGVFQGRITSKDAYLTNEAAARSGRLLLLRSIVLERGLTGHGGVKWNVLKALSIAQIVNLPSKTSLALLGLCETCGLYCGPQSAPKFSASSQSTLEKVESRPVYAASFPPTMQLLICAGDRMLAVQNAVIEYMGLITVLFVMRAFSFSYAASDHVGTTTKA